MHVALGDSISIDAYAGGPGCGGASLLARNRDEDFPDWRGRDLATLRPGLRSALLAVDGGTTAGLLADQLPRVLRLPEPPSLVTVTVGGNDVLQHYGDTAGAMATVRVVRERVSHALGVLAQAAPGARVAVGTVYDPSDGTGEAERVGLPPWPDVVEVLAALGDGLRAAAAEHGARVAEIHAAFLGHGLARGDPAQPLARPADRDLWYCDVIEPNAWGASAVRAACWDALDLPALERAG